MKEKKGKRVVPLAQLTLKVKNQNEKKKIRE